MQLMIRVLDITGKAIIDLDHDGEDCGGFTLMKPEACTRAVNDFSSINLQGCGVPVPYHHQILILLHVAHALRRLTLEYLIGFYEGNITTLRRDYLDVEAQKRT